MRIALLCSGLSNIQRGHEIFARDLFELLKDSLDITLFKGGGDPAPGEIVIDNVSRNSPFIKDVHVAASQKWVAAMQESERLRLEAETFAYAALKPLLEGGYDIIHCLEKDVCNIIYDHRHFFSKTPKIVFSNGGAMPARDLPRCDFVQEHTDYNLARSAKGKAFMIPHGVDTELFHPGVHSDFRARHGIPEDAFVVISVGTICYWHKRMDYVIREVSGVPDAWLVIVGQECPDTPAIVQLGKELMGERIIFTKMAHHDLPQAYAAADVFVLGSLFETFGIVYIEAMAMGLPVICTDHENQKLIVKEGIFIDMKHPGALRKALEAGNRHLYAPLRNRGPQIAREFYDLRNLRQRYIEQYRRIETAETRLPRYTLGTKLSANVRNAFRRATGLFAR
ncbi:MAG: glycosyltransferase family 4 protein [Rhodocyclaceae bacterium]|jgi:1,2-diacylglycerol 3-alpha-glucosyltransferase|nr:glycosyltransferase family 4 protein [Rhodocyclaceae bacterium]